jgi:hypothetical protein
METTSVTIGYIILGFAIIALGFLPVFIAMYKKNVNASQIYKATPLAILGLGAVGLGLSLLFQALEVNREVWALVILLVIEAIRVAIWIYLIIMAVKDKDLPIF